MHINKLAVTGNSGRNFPADVHDCFKHKFGCAFFCQKHRNIAFPGNEKQVFRWLHTTATYNAGNVIGKVLFQHTLASILSHGIQVGHFNLANDLRTFKSKVLVKAAELHAWPVDISGLYIPLLLSGGGQDLQGKGLNEIGNPDHMHSPS